MVQHMRLSQFVLTWGPGSILEGSRGPRIIPLPDIGLFYQHGLNPADFEISDQRMSQGLLNGNHVFRLPSNAELGISQNRALYCTRPFPEWKLCHNTNRHIYGVRSGFSVLFTHQRCPICNSTRGVEPVRFVRACSRGHLDDVDWWYLVHHKNPGQCQHSGWFIWTGTGSSLRQINIECPRCGMTVNLGWAYGQSWPCSGRFPEREGANQSPQRLGCSANARIIQRQASNLRIPELRALFTIPPRYTRLHNLLQLPHIYGAIAATLPSSFDQFQNMLNNLQSQGLITPATVQEILDHPWDEIQHAIHDILQPISRNYTALLLEEFHAFIDASINGIPPLRGPTPTSRPLIEVDPNRTVRVFGPRGRKFRIVPVLSLRTVIVQLGYRREIDTHTPAAIVDVSFPDSVNPQQRWYPGVEFFGEGIFIMLDENGGWHFDLGGSDVNLWLDAANNAYPGFVFRDPMHKDELNPVFVWWHTLSHLLIRAISAEAGYPSASIRERVYLEKSGADIRGGILLYAVQPGSEGTMGGLIALVPHFQTIFERAFDMLDRCSSDPLCLENQFHSGHYCGAACYGCLFLSETSCEHRNMWLDRRILMKNLP